MTSPETLQIGELIAEPGTRAYGIVLVDLGEAVAELPIVIVNGARPGPRVGVHAGIHGCEYVGIEALRQVAMGLDPAEVSGSLVASLISSPLAYSTVTVYHNPADGRNPNRAFPGDAVGGPTDRLVAWLAKTVIEPADVFIDMHGGDINEALVPFSIVMPTGDSKVDDRSFAMAEAYGLPYMVVTGPNADGVSAQQYAGSLGIPSVLGEAGGQGLWGAEEVGIHADGLRRALEAAGLAPAETAPAPTSTRLKDWLWLRTDATGAWRPDVKVGDSVKAGDPLGEVHDVFGEHQETIESPEDGVVLFTVTGLAINAGDHVLAIGMV